MESTHTQLYTFYSCKKIYFRKTPSRCFLLEKMSHPFGISLIPRRPVVVSKNGGILLFPKS